MSGSSSPLSSTTTTSNLNVDLMPTGDAGIPGNQVFELQPLPDNVNNVATPIVVQTEVGLQPAVMKQEDIALANRLISALNPALAAIPAVGRLNWFEYDIVNKQFKYEKADGSIGYLTFKADDPAHVNLVPIIKQIDDELFKNMYGKAAPDFARHEAGIVTLSRKSRAFQKLDAAHFATKTFDDAVERAKECFNNRRGRDPSDAAIAILTRAKTNMTNFVGRLKGQIAILKNVPTTAPNYLQTQEKIAALQAQVAELESPSAGFALAMAIFHTYDPAYNPNVSIENERQNIAEAVQSYDRSYDLGSNKVERWMTEKWRNWRQTPTDVVKHEHEREKASKIITNDIMALVYALNYSDAALEAEGQFEFRQACAKAGVDAPGDRLALHKNIAYFVDDANPTHEVAQRHRALLASSLKFDLTQDREILGRLIPGQPAAPVNAVPGHAPNPAADAPLEMMT